MVLGGRGMDEAHDDGGQPRRNPYRRGRSGGLFSWAWVVVGVLCGVLLVVLGIQRAHVEDVLVGLGLITVCVLLSRAVRQALARKWAEARWQHPDTTAPVVIYWRSDDLHSLRLRSALKELRDRAVWVNLFWWGDAEGTVRVANGGDEPLPYVVINGEGYLDPVPDVVRDALADLPVRDQGIRRKSVSA